MSIKTRIADLSGWFAHINERLAAWGDQRAWARGWLAPGWRLKSMLFRWVERVLR